MPPAPDFFGVRPGQDLDDMVEADAEARFFAHPIDARQKFLGGNGPVVNRSRRKAVVAGPATLGLEGLAEVAEQFTAPTARALRVMHHLLQLLARDFLFHVAGAEQQQGLAGQPIASGAAGFLVIALNVFRQVVVDDEAHVGLVDAHAEGNRRAHHPDIVAQK